MEHIHQEYVGIFSGFNDQYLRKAVKTLLAEKKADKWDVIIIKRVTKKERNDTDVYSHTFQKRVRKGRKTITVNKTIYFKFKVTRHNAYYLSLPTIPIRIWDEKGWDWWIPQSAKEEGRKKK